MNDNSSAWSKAWNDVQTLSPIIEATKGEMDMVRRLPDAIKDAFVERDVYRLMLPVEFGGGGLDPLQQFDLTLEVSRHDASAGWNYSLAMNGASLAGVMPIDEVRKRFATPDCGGAGAGGPTGRAILVDGGCRVTGRWSFASGMYEAKNLLGGCLVYDGDKPRMGPDGGLTVVHVTVPVEQAELFDTWKTCGMRGTGSADFALDDVFVPEERMFRLFTGESILPHPFFRLPPTSFGFALAAVPLGAALTTIEALKELAVSKRRPPPGTTLSEESAVQYLIGKSEATIESAILYVRDAFARMWEDTCAERESTMETRARVRRAMVHAVDASIEVVGACFRAAGGTAVYESAPFERALRDVYVVGGHHVFQRSMLEEAGRVAMGMKPNTAMF